MQNAKVILPKVKAIDFVPIYGMYTYHARINPEIWSFKDYVKDSVRDLDPRTWRKTLSLEDAVSLGTSDWPTPKTTREHIGQLTTAAQNSAMVGYHSFLVPVLGATGVFYGLFYALSKLQ